MLREIISETDAKNVIEDAENTFNKCFDILVNIKHASKMSNELILDFQPLLAECLYELMTFYQKLQDEKKYIISHKNVWEQEKFKELITHNAKYVKIVKETIEIGKTLGDAFAWIFYYQNREQLEMHFEHESTGLFVAGIGGKGEIEFIKKNQNINGLFVVYHGITNMLRVGDFSLYAIDRGIVGVGELKSKQIGDKINVTVNISSKVKISKFFENQQTECSFEENIKKLQKDFPSLPKQIKVQDSLMNAQKSNHSSDAYADYEYNIIEHMSPETSFALNADNSLLLYADWREGESLFDFLVCNKQNSLNEDFTKYVTKLKAINSPYNQFIVSEIDTKMFSHRIPVFWWKINDELCKKIYFKKVLILTIYNPAQIIQLFLDEGFEVTNFDKIEDIKLEKISNDKRIEVGSIQMYTDLINHNLMKTESVFSTVKIVMNEFENGKIPTDTKISVRINQNNFGKLLNE